LAAWGFRDSQHDVVGLFMSAESSSLICSCCRQFRQGLLTMLPGGFQRTLFAKFLSLIIQSFCNTVGVKQDGVAWSQFPFFHGAIPFVEQAHHRAGWG
jgi:hypothetical protein